MLEYEFDEKLLSDGTLRVLRFDAYTSEWAEFIFANRDFKQNFSHNYDVVYGPIANDNVGEQIRKFSILGRAQIRKGYNFSIRVLHGKGY